MVPTKTGQSPQITCDHALIPSCTVTWSDIITLIPHTFMQEQRIKTLIPEFTFSDASFVIGIPEFSLEQQKVIIGLPQFKVKSAVLNAKKIEGQSKDLATKISVTKQQQIKDGSTSTNQLFACFRTDLNDQKAKAASMFEEGVTKLDASIVFMRTVGADPANVVDGSGKSMNLVAQLADLISKREVAFKQFDDGMKKLEDAEKVAVDRMSQS